MARASTTRKEKCLCALCVLPLSSEQRKDACEYQEKGHHSADNKQQEFTEEVWFHQLLSTHEPPPICTLIFTSAGQKTRSSNTLNSRFSMANIKQKLTKCEHREDASPVMPAQQRPPISHRNSCARPAKVPSDTASRVRFALTQVVLGIDLCV